MGFYRSYSFSSHQKKTDTAHYNKGMSPYDTSSSTKKPWQIRNTTYS